MSPETFDRACSLLESALTGDGRAAILADAAKSGDLRRSLIRLREGMRSHVLRAGSDRFDLDGFVREYDASTRRDGFHVLHDWDGKGERVNPETIPVDVLTYIIDRRAAAELHPSVAAIALDYYLLYVVALLSLRVWDAGDPDANLDRLDRLLGHLQGAAGSGHRFVDNVATLLLVATSHYEPDDAAYDALLARVRTLGRSHRGALALVHAASLGSHLRFGFQATYGRDIVLMRDDNTVDYPWVCFSLATLMTEYDSLRVGADDFRREAVVEAMLNGLSFDARAFIGTPPSSLSAHEVERAAFCEHFRRYREDLLTEFERHRPSPRRYSPVSFFFNFAYNVLKGIVVDALLRGEPSTLTLNDLLTDVPAGGAIEAAKERLVTTLMGYARANPDTIRGRLMPVIVYDPQAGREAFTMMMRKLREAI